ncbi:hypothetical protein CQW23_33274 [Capsicum baccatum]|uniref:Ubiquitin-like protease family profile domain-containing protein n=1 Tax=Capsicum baccatum TaxID=33114 RepID=A0A2G2V2B0_CAPBA|nr:hypothetical protein CQW23_33274 [Capsicum baccatum]
MYENKDKMDEVWINYNGIPICFGWEEFAIVTGLKYYPPSPSQVIPTLTQKKAPRTPKKEKGKSSDRDYLVSIVGPSFKNKNLIEALKGKGLSKKYKQSLCLVWFVHNVLWARDVNNNISLDLINLSEDLEIVHPWIVPTNRELEMLFFLTLRYVQTLSDPKVVDEIKMELFGATTITRKIILEGGANDAPLTVFETTSHYDYVHNGCTDFSPDFAASSECSSCKCQDCKVKHDGVINAINALTASVKKMTSKRCVIPSKRISYPDTPLEIKTAKKRRKDTSKASSIIKKARLQCLCLCLAPIFSVQGTQKSSLPWHLVDEVYIPINCGDEFHWVLAVIILKERRIQVYDSMSRRRRSGSSSEIQKLAKILPTYLDMSDLLDQKVRTDWDCGPFVAAYAEYLSDGLQVPNDGLDAGLLRKRYVALLGKYGEAKAQKPYITDVKDRRRPKPNSIALDEEQLVHID